MRRRSWVLSVTITLVALLAAGTAGASGQRLGVVTCADGVATVAKLGPHPTVIGGRLAGLTLRSPRSMAQIAPTGDPVYAYFSKIAIIVRAGTAPFTIKLAPSWRARAGMEWDNTSGHVISDGVRVVPCAHGDDNGVWVAYPGGFYVAGPVCLPIEITMGAQRTTRRIPLGVACR
jgi:hypothetical protein